MIQRILGRAFVACGVALVIGGRVYHFVQHPEWTEAEFFRKLFGVWFVACLFLLVGYALFTSSPSDGSPRSR